MGCPAACGSRAVNSIVRNPCIRESCNILPGLSSTHYQSYTAEDEVDELDRLDGGAFDRQRDNETACRTLLASSLATMTSSPSWLQLTPTQELSLCPAAHSSKLLD